MDQYAQINQFLEKHLDDSLTELSKLVAQPSVAAQNLGLDDCAALVGKMLTQRGFSVQILPTPGAPVVIAERKGKSDKTLLFYNHYDVQPAEPLELWKSPPFEPELRNGKLYGRGVSDDKGHLTARLHALDAILNTEGELPCNVKFIVEGEEEIGSVHLHDFILQNKNLLSADACIWEFGGVDHQDTPMQFLGLRGICYVELSVETASTDIHSGLGGSIIPNAAWRLVWALGTLKDKNEQIKIPGFYDGIIPASEKDREYLDALPDARQVYQQQFGIKSFLKEFTSAGELLMAEVFEPTCTICGLTSGYQGTGSKTVLPARASAKIDFRLLPGQIPEDIVAKLRAHLDAQGFSDVQVTPLAAQASARTAPDDPFVQLVANSAESIYGSKMQLVPMVGGSGPIYPFVHDLGIPVATAGLGYPDARVHAPNENIRLDLYLKHAQHMAHVLMEFAK